MTRPAAGLIALLVLGMLAGPPAAAGQQAGRVPRLGILRPGLPLDPYLEAFRRGLRELGYVEGRNLLVEYRWAHGRTDRLPELAAELVRLKVDVIMVGGTQGTRAAQRATSTIPIVMAAVGDPITSRFVASLARPGANITGVTLLQPELSGRRLELLKEAVPAISRAAVLRNPASISPSSPLWTATEAAARALGVQLETVDARTAPELESAFAAMSRRRAEALFVLPDPTFSNQRGRITDLAAQSRLPAMYEGREFVEAGGLMSYAASLRDQFRRAATFVDRILKGAKPGDLPVEQPTRFELVVNVRTAKALGLTIPPSLLAQADDVIQ